MSSEAIMSDVCELIRERLALVAPTQIPELKILAQTDISNRLIHISCDPKLKEFVPFISRRMGNREDNHLPRICAATTLAGAVIGYAKDIYDFEELSRTEEGWIGGYVIYTFDYEGAVRPSSKLVYDADQTDEHWLINYSPETTAYKPIQAGRFFCSQLVTKRDPAEKALTIVREFFVEVYNGFEIAWRSGIKLTPGYYRITSVNLCRTDYTQADGDTVVSIEKAEYLAAKQLTASLLSFVEPASSQW